MASLFKNIEHSQVYDLAGLVDYQKGKVASLTLSQQTGVGVTLFAIDEGEGSWTARWRSPSAMRSMCSRRARPW